ncbi:DUF6445 family protein [Sphingomonas sp. LM7]|uniref:DUF6445 family protein n=1 Tax=Sphingomonas sp. LM7 TaxID=1938607 RepID=UPI000983C057|nr:DUF6445 family protein [Sphingomonas sp. LM7]AQR73669.1 hypothetical protein BXU08_08485 [Sphingomonas sp. LM7]
MKAYDFALNSRPTLSLRPIGSEGEPLLQIDDVLRDPQALIDFAAEEARFEPAYGSGGGYPGIRASAPLEYVETVVRAVDPLLREAFGLARVKLGKAECNLSLVTLPAASLVAAQREPHVDTGDPLQFAFLHYLCAGSFGGTAFYRHRATGFETLTPERLDRYQAARARERGEEAAAGYIVSDTAHFLQTATVEAAFNGLAIYRSRVLHSGKIAPDAPLSADPRRGRLTANIFLTYRQA